MITRCFESWLDQRKYAWSGRFATKDEITSFILGHTSRGTGIGKVLSKLKLDFSPEYSMFLSEYHESKRLSIIQEGVLAFNAARYVPQVSFTDDPNVVAETYKSIYSCMTNHADQMAEFLTHPLLLSQGIRLATYTHRGEIVARCVVNLHEQSRNEVYSIICGQEFEMALKELGFRDDALTVSHLKLPHGWVPYMDEIGADGFVKCRIADNEDWCFIVPEDNVRYKEVTRRVRRIVPDFSGGLEWYDKDGWKPL
jgi:hypothetical protein